METSMLDGYTKAVLTIIAAALSVIALQAGLPKAVAQSSCGSSSFPCFVVVQNAPLWVTTDFSIAPRR
jgi:hypothetical protein